MKKNTFLIYKQLIVLLILVFTTSLSFAQMRNIYLDSDSNLNILKFNFYSPNEGYIATTKWIGFTQDSGRNYIKNTIRTNNVDFNGFFPNLTFGFGINGVHAFNKDTVIVYGDYGLVPSILYSTDGCLNFKLVYHSQFSSWELKTGIKDMVFPENNAIGYAVDADRFLRTTDRGRTWTTRYTNQSAFYDKIEAISNSNLIVYSTSYGKTQIQYTQSSGLTWSEYYLPYQYSWRNVFSVHYYSTSKIWINLRDANQIDYLYYSSNNGWSWKLMNRPTIGGFAANKIQFINDSTGFVTENLYSTLLTTDSGKVWQKIQRNNSFKFNEFGHNTFQVINKNQLWAGGMYGFTEINTNLSLQPFPKSDFFIDTVGVAISKVVNLRNFSKPSYQFKWFKNDTLISNAYNFAYTRNIYKLIDTIKLIVTNSVGSDTSFQIIRFNPPIRLTSFSPQQAESYSTITIIGQNLQFASGVLFGGVPAFSFNIVSNTRIDAVVGTGASGNITVLSSTNNESLSSFVFLPPPTIDLPYTVAKTILCKGEPARITINNTQPYSFYQIYNEANGFAVANGVQGNGGTINLVASIKENGVYKIRVSNVSSWRLFPFTNTINFTLENTKANFVASKVNITRGEVFDVASTSLDAQQFSWDFGVGASTRYSSLQKVQNLSYNVDGLKYIKLISTSNNGCKDTLESASVFVYSNSNLASNCYTQVINDSDYAYMPSSPPIAGEISLANNNGYFVCGGGNNPILNSKVGISKKIIDEGNGYFAHYNSQGILKWHISIINKDSYFKNFIRFGNTVASFTSSVQDELGNIYILGRCSEYNYIHFPNGDSLRINRTINDSFSTGGGFIVKVDSLGKYIWHANITGVTNSNGYPTNGGFPDKLVMRNNQLLISGVFYYRPLNYIKNTNNYKIAPSIVGTYPSPHNLYTFILRIDTAGKFKWGTFTQNRTTNYRFGIAGVEIDNQGNSYVLGNFEDEVILRDNFDSSFSLRKFRGANTYLWKLDSSGKHSWFLDFNDLEPAGISSDGDSNVYITGSTSPFYPVLNHNGYLLSKISKNGQIKWTVGSRKSYYGFGRSVLFKNNNIYTAFNLANNGLESDTFTLTSSNNINVTRQVHSTEFLVARYDTSGILKGVFQSGTLVNTGYNLNSTPNKILQDNQQNFLISGMLWMPSNNNQQHIFNTPILANGYEVFFGKYNINFCSTVTPLTLISFNAIKKQENVLLTWETANQVNTSHFNIQKSIDGINFETIGIVKSKGNGNYNFLDSKLISSNRFFYRLQIIDYDGMTQYSDIKVVEFESQLVTSVFPNPNNGNFIIKLNSPFTGENNLKIFDQIGKIVHSQKIQVGSTSINLSTKLSNGIYFLQIANNSTNSISNFKILIQK